MTMSAALVTISCGRAMEGVAVAVVWDASVCWDIFVEVGYWCESGAVKLLNIMEQKSVRWRPGRGHQLGSPSSSMPPNAGPTLPSLSMLAPSWDSPPLSPELQPSAADQQWECHLPWFMHIWTEWLDGAAASKPQPIPAISWQLSPQPMATDAAAVTWVYKDSMTKGQLQHQWKKHGSLQFFLRD
ncbi:hypothetical protein F5J12DRAFT_783029 [Pisolithus orientalis]|uniref:uncharacterized protein n=1 Tax=Pisolithus orientalis TaxID=936130 RepID=UPI0022248B1A|nr:uncharacterized protein F5J12DRAFT_783029 [Pisolithus orientalis]KAI6006256.1 hypothetical protein F5J12DRAFT_783029 [Pisolithus orientalis]